MNAVAEVKDTLRPWLHEWARWYRGTASSGYADSTTLYRAMRGRIEIPPQSSIPHGATPWTSLEELTNAMNVLREQGQFLTCISIMRAFYVLGMNDTVKETGLRPSQIYKYREQGETALRAYLLAAR